jgi:hypothetical protein
MYGRRGEKGKAMGGGGVCERCSSVLSLEAIWRDNQSAAFGRNSRVLPASTCGYDVAYSSQLLISKESPLKFKD